MSMMILPRFRDPSCLSLSSTNLLAIFYRFHVPNRMTAIHLPREGDLYTVQLNSGFLMMIILDVGVTLSCSWAKRSGRSLQPQNIFFHFSQNLSTPPKLF